MKVYRVFLVSFLAFIMMFTFGCGTNLSYGIIERDSALTGGNLSFVYDSSTHTATFGKEGEVVAYYPEDTELGRTGGNRIGVKIYAPSEVTDYSKAKLNFEGTENVSGSFMMTVYDQIQNYFVLTPLVSDKNKELKVYVTWTPDSAEQIYTIKIAEGVKFAEKA